MANNIGLDAVHIKATQQINENQNEILYKKVAAYKDKKIGIIGIAFKPDTTVVTESPGYILYERLRTEQYDVVGFDLLAEIDYTGIESLQKFLDICDVIVLTHNKKLYSNLQIKGKILIDPWKIIN
jgi:UDPglucose 6-dehydrogenase